MVVATYQGIFKHDKCYGAVNMALNQRGIAPYTIPVTQYVSTWQYRAGGERLTRKDTGIGNPSVSSGIYKMRVNAISFSNPMPKFIMSYLLL